MKTLVLAALAALLACPALATSCGPRQQVLAALQGKYGETRQTIGLDSTGKVFETFANTETGSWTIIMTAPNGTTCMMASGQAHETVATPRGEDS